MATPTSQGIETRIGAVNKRAGVIQITASTMAVELLRRRARVCLHVNEPLSELKMGRGVRRRPR